MFADHLDEVPLGVTGQGRFAEVRILRKEVRRLGVQVGEVATATAGHQDLLARFVGVVEQQHLTAATGGGQGTHQASGACANDDHFGGTHCKILEIRW
ncbi:hypothetical protein D3C72_2116870 [compost metagenome]